jgi:hypothetical protein
MVRKLLIGGIPVFIAVQPSGSLQAIIGQIVLISYLSVTIWVMPFLDFWDNVISIGSMAGDVSLICGLSSKNFTIPHFHGCDVCTLGWLLFAPCRA